MTRAAEEMGRLAVRIPGWRWMPGMRIRSGSVRSWGTVVTVHPAGFVDYWDPELENLFSGVHPSWLDIDPDDPATAGWLLAMLGDSLTRAFWHGINVTVRVNIMPPKGERVFISEHGERGFNQPTLGLACIAAAEALGRWPGGVE